MTNPFFKNYGPIKLKDAYKVLEIKNESNNKKIQISDIADLNSASSKDITFFHSSKYKLPASTTKAAACITTKNLQHILDTKNDLTNKLIVFDALKTEFRKLKISINPKCINKC